MSRQPTLKATQKKKAIEFAYEKIFYELRENLLWIQWKKKFLREMLTDSYNLGYRQKEAIKYRGLIDVYFFAKTILGYDRLRPGTHRRPCDFLDKPDRLKIMMMPRDFFKTTLGTKAKSLQMLANDPSLRILMISNTATNAQKFLFEIEKKVENGLLLSELYPHMIPPKARDRRWSSEAMDIVRDSQYSEASIEALGIEGSSTSRHYDVIIEDDLVDEDQLINREQMEKVIDAHQYLQYLYVQPRKKTNFIYGTRWAYYDFLSYMMEAHSDYKLFKMAIVDHEGQPTFPEEFPLKTIEAMKEDNPLKFSTFAMNDPLPGEMQDLKVEWLNFYEKGKEPRSEDMTILILIDPSIGENEKNCYTAIVTVGLQERRDGVHIWVLDAFHGIIPVDSKNPKETSLVSATFKRVAQYNPYTVAIETTAFQKVLKYLFTLHMERKGKYFNITEVPHYSNQHKWDRVMKLAGPMASGRIHVREDMEELISEVKGCRMARRIDVLDALAFSTELLNTELLPFFEAEEKKTEDFSFEDIIERLGGENPWFDDQERNDASLFLQ